MADKSYWPGDDELYTPDAIMCSEKCETCFKYFEFPDSDPSTHKCDACDKPVCPECVIPFEKLGNEYEHCIDCYKKEFPDEF